MPDPGIREPGSPESILAARRLTKTFGGLTAIDDVDFDAYTNEVHAVIGPNGAGKTTLVGQLTGDLRPDAGTVSFAGQDITALAPFRRAKLGIARSFQITSVFLDKTILENVALAVQARLGVRDKAEQIGQRIRRRGDRQEQPRLQRFQPAPCRPV